MMRPHVSLFHYLILFFVFACFEEMMVEDLMCQQLFFVVVIFLKNMIMLAHVENVDIYYGVRC